VSLSLLSPCVLLSVARICIAVPSLFGAHRPGTQNDLALFSLSDMAGHVFPIQQNRSEAFRMFRPHMTLRKKCDHRILRLSHRWDRGKRSGITCPCYLQVVGVTTASACCACCACCVTLDAVYPSPNRMLLTLCMSAPTLRPTWGCLVLPSHVSALLPWWRMTFLLIGASRDLSNTQTDLSCPGNTYSIKNIGSGTARVFFAQAREVTAQIDYE
jgi:hypothetical protein